MREDLRTAYRALRRAPLFAAVTVIVLALGIGATTAIYSVVDAVVLRGLPFDEHDRLVAVGERYPDEPQDGSALVSSSPQNYADWAARQDVFTSMAALAGRRFVLSARGVEAEEVRALAASAEFFDMLRIAPALGQPFGAAHTVEGQHRVAVLGHDFWQRRFGGDVQVIGQSLVLNGEPYSILGVLQARDSYPPSSSSPTDVYVPYVVPPEERERSPSRKSTYLQVVARLAPGVSLEQAQARMTAIAASLRAEHPVWNEGTDAAVESLHEFLFGGETRRWMLLLLGAAAVVLLIAGVNVAMLQLSRATAREHEMGVRLGLGGSRWRVIRQLLVEHVVLALGAAVVAAVLAAWGVTALRAVMPASVPRVSDIGVNWRLFAAAAGLGLCVGVVTGVTPAARLSAPRLALALHDRTRTASGRTGHTARRALIVFELALSVLLLVGASLFTRSLWAVTSINPGFDTSRLLTAGVAAVLPGPTGSMMQLSNPPTQAPVTDHLAGLQDIVDRLADAPGVAGAAVVQGGAPLNRSMFRGSIEVDGRNLRSAPIDTRRVSDGYHAVLRIPLADGRYFDLTDRINRVPVAIVNRRAAALLFDAERAVGRTLRVQGVEHRIVGVVDDVRQQSLEDEPVAQVNVPWWSPIRGLRAANGTLVIRSREDPHTLVPIVRRTVAEVYPDVPVRSIQTMDETVARLTAERRFNMVLLGAFGVLGLLIATIGVYGTLAYSVAQRTREIGVRMALGATARRVVGLVVSEVGRLVIVGVGLGALGAWWLSAVVQSYLYSIEARDTASFAAATIGMTLAAAIATVVPARRAAAVQPATALRAE